MGKRRQDGSWGPRPQGHIWSRALRDEVPPRFLFIYTVFLPIAYNICLAFGVAAAIIIVPSIRAFTGQEAAHLLALIIGALGLAAFIGLAARLERLEFYVTTALTVALCWYPGVLIVSSFHGEWDRLPAGIGEILLPMIPAARAIDIIRTARRRIASAAPRPECRPAQ